MKSFWRHCRSCANSREHIKDWAYTNDKFKYIDDQNKQRLYLLDFKLINNDDSILYIETKGKVIIIDELKWKAIKDQGYELQILREKELKKYEKQFNILRFGSIRKLQDKAFK